MLKQLKWPHHTLITTSWGWEKKNKERRKNCFVPTMAHISQVQGSRTHLPSPGTLHMSFPNSLPYKDQAKSWETDRYRPAHQDHECAPTHFMFPASIPRLLGSPATYICPHSPLSLIPFCVKEICSFSKDILFLWVAIKNSLPF